MKKATYQWALIAPALTLMAGTVSACPQNPPAGMSATRVGEDVVVNGVTVSMMRVQSRELTAVVFARIEKQWNEAGYTVKRNTAAKWAVLSALSEQCMTTLQLVDEGGASGYFAVNRLDKPAAALAVLPALPPGAKVLSSVVSNDDGRPGTTMALTSREPLDAVSAFFVGSLRDDKWEGVRSDIELDKNMQAQSALVTGQRGRRRVDIIIWREGDTRIVVTVADTL